jgi:hypothetical protein
MSGKWGFDCGGSPERQTDSALVGPADRSGSLLAFNVRVLLHSTSDGNRLPPFASGKSNTDDSPNQRANWWAIDKSDSPKAADVGVKRVTGSCVVYSRGDESGQCPSSKSDGEMSSSRGSTKNFEATEFASAVSQSITACALVYNERVRGQFAQMRQLEEAVCSHHESNRSSRCNC